MQVVVPKLWYQAPNSLVPKVLIPSLLVPTAPKALVPKALLVPNGSMTNLVLQTSSGCSNHLESSRWAHAHHGPLHSLPVGAKEEAYIQTEVKLGKG